VVRKKGNRKKGRGHEVKSKRGGVPRYGKSVGGGTAGESKTVGLDALSSKARSRVPRRNEEKAADAVRN